MEIGTISWNEEQAPGGGSRRLQRIQDGLSLLAWVSGGRLALRERDGSKRVWEEVPVGDRETEARGGPFDATLEAFRNGMRLAGEAIREEGLKRLQEDPSVCLRLVLNHDAEGCPLVRATWAIEGIEVVGRPGLAEEAGEHAWKAARAIPCREIRVYRLDAHGNWSVSTEPGCRDVVCVAPVEALPIRDRYTELCRRIPARPRALPFRAPPIKPGNPREDPESFRMCIRTKTSKEECR